MASPSNASDTLIKGTSVTIMEQLGHFPMSENPEQFRCCVAPVLTAILKQTSSDKQGVPL